VVVRNKLGQTRLFRKVDDTLGVVHTHGVAGLCGGLLVGLLADPHVVEYLGQGSAQSVSATGLFFGHPKQLLIQAGAALTVIVWDALITFLILKFLGLFMKLRMPDEALEIGDIAFHEEEAYPGEALAIDGVRADRQPPKPTEPAPVPKQESDDGNVH
jgi:Amt family ammonium transporter